MQLQRTTLRIKKALYKQVKRLAVEEEKSLQEIINEALRNYLYRPLEQEKKEKALVFKDKEMGYKLNRPLTRKDLH